MAWLVVGALPAGAEADPFYVSLLRDGVDAAASNDLPRAEESLKLACFGFLEDLDLLAEGLVRLALVQTRRDDPDAFRQTFRRILEIEDRFGAYTKAPLAGDLRRDFEEQAAALVPETLLDGSDTFRRLVEAKLVASLDSLPPAQRRAALEERRAAAPADPRWSSKLARLELDEGRPSAALAALEGLSALGADTALGCLRAEARVRSGDCGASTDLVRCERATSDAAVVLPLLECWRSQGRSRDAEAFLAQLEPSVSGRRELVRLRRQIEKDLRQAREAEPPTPTGSPEGQSGDSDGAPVAEEPNAEAPSPVVSVSKPLPAADQQRLQEARQLLSSARLAGDLDEAFALASEVADAHPEATDAQFLAAEIAYRSSRWTEAAAYFRRGGDPGDGQPVLLFFMAVSLFESGDRTGAAVALRRSLPQIQRSSYVERYAEKILGSSPRGEPDPR